VSVIGLSDGRQMSEVIEVFMQNRADSEYMGVGEVQRQFGG